MAIDWGNIANNWWTCAINDEGDCGFWGGATCFVWGGVISAALYLVGYAAIAKLVARLSISAARAMIPQIRKMLKKLTTAFFILDGESFDLVFDHLADLLRSIPMQVLEFMSRTIYEQSRRLCKCMLCYPDPEEPPDPGPIIW